MVPGRVVLSVLHRLGCVNLVQRVLALCRGFRPAATRFGGMALGDASMIVEIRGLTRLRCSLTHAVSRRGESRKVVHACQQVPFAPMQTCNSAAGPCLFGMIGLQLCPSVLRASTMTPPLIAERPHSCCSATAALSSHHMPLSAFLSVTV